MRTSTKTAVASSLGWDSVPDSAEAGIRVQLLRDANALREISTDWGQLWRQTPEVSAFQTLEWTLACALHGSPDIYAMVLRAESEPLAIFPTRLSSRGVLSFIGAKFSNYCGPVYLPDSLPSVMTAWRNAVSADPQIRSINLTGLRERSPFLRLLTHSAFPRWGAPVMVEMFTCPEVDLREGWAKLVGKHKPRQRANWRRKWDRLAQLGRLEFIETSNPDKFVEVFPRLVELYDLRWRGKRIGMSFAQHPQLQLEAAQGLGSRNLMRLSLLCLDRKVIAFSYAMRGHSSSSSYVLAHDGTFDVFSPGLLLLMKILEAAAAQGDTYYDFSLGSLPYKAMWASGDQRVFSVLLGRGAALAGIRRRCWRAARSIPILRKLKQEGFRGITKRKKGKESLPDWPGLAAGSPQRWHVHRIQHARQSAELLRPLRCFQMRAIFSPRLLALALDRHYRGDQALALEREGIVVGAIWKTAQHRRALVTGMPQFSSEPLSVYYHPVAAEGEDIEQIVLGAVDGDCVIVSARPLRGERIQESYTFQGDL